MLGFTTLSARFPGMSQLIQRVLDDRFLYEKPDDVVLSFVSNWGKISSFIQAGGVGKLILDEEDEFTLPDLRKVVMLINNQHSAPVVNPSSCLDEVEAKQDCFNEENANLLAVPVVKPPCCVDVFEAKLDGANGESANLPTAPVFKPSSSLDEFEAKQDCANEENANLLAAPVVKPPSCVDEFEPKQDGVNEESANLPAVQDVCMDEAELNQEGINEEKAGDDVDHIMFAWMKSIRKTLICWLSRK